LAYKPIRFEFELDYSDSVMPRETDIWLLEECDEREKFGNFDCWGLLLVKDNVTDN